MKIKRRKSRQVNAGGVLIGGGANIPVQSMTNADAEDTGATLRQVRALARAGCDLVRVAVPSKRAALALGKITKSSPVPIIADIHFRGELALYAIDSGAAKVRLNPGNIKDKKTVRDVLDAARNAGVPIRVGANSGSIRNRSDSSKKTVPQLMVEKVLRWCEEFESHGFEDIVLSLKASTVTETIDAYREAAGRCGYPLHLGVTAAGLPEDALVKSAVGLGVLLSEGLGDTLRVSLTTNPVKEVAAALAILRSLELRSRGIEIISCPTCGRTKIDVEGLARKVKTKLRGIEGDLTVAVMGCEVNGPGEAAEADCGIAGGSGFGTVFVRGKKANRVRERDILDALLDTVKKISGGDQ